MNHPLILRPEAEKDLLDAYRWYDELGPGLAHRFLESVERTLAQIEREPHGFAEVHEGVLVLSPVPSHTASSIWLKTNGALYSLSSTPRAILADG